LAVVAIASVAFATLPPGGTFIDDDGHIFEGAIEAIAAEGITSGCNPPANDRFCPNDKVTRGEMAVFLVRAMGYSDNGGGNLFIDDDGLFYENSADRLKTAKVTLGCNPPTNDKYCGSRNVTRGEMAALLVRAKGYTDNGGGNLFTDDDGHLFENATDKLGTAKVTLGCNPPVNDHFCPNDHVTRGQMAAFLSRALKLSPITPPPPGSFLPFTVSGTGNDVIDFQIPGDVPAVLDLTHNGTSNFIVWSLDTSFAKIDLLVNEIGNYQGRRMVHGGWFTQPELVRHLEIKADGAWSITAQPMSAARSMTSSLTGSGDDIVRYEGSASTLTSTHDGTSNFIIWGYESDGKIAGLIVNEIGSYSGTDLIDFGTAIFDITADGNWTLKAP
ncbi:MAG: S-layer homology domain-containing protein, partial [Pseudomonadales bacterium]